MRVNNLEQYTQEECPYFESCPLGDSDPKCHRFYIDCPRFIDYLIGEEKAQLLEKKEKKKKI